MRRIPTLDGCDSSKHAMTGFLGETGRVSFVELHPDTDPAVIEGIHRDDVYHAVTVLDTTDVPTLSSWLILPEWNVRRALAALNMETAAPTPRTKRPPISDTLTQAVADGEWFVAFRLATRVGVALQSVNWFIRQRRGEFEKGRQFDEATRRWATAWRWTGKQS